ncbi:ANKHD1 [Symbiodinium sp. CCMP2592]|nr:ANKHD1 [Symbiodinium sp. CCMP2592]
MGASFCASVDERCTCSLQSTIHTCRFPLWAVKVSDFLEMQGPPRPHHLLQEEGLLHEWFPGMFVIFTSHQWLSSTHPDPQGQQMEVLQKALRGMIDGSLQVHEDLVARSTDMNLSNTIRQHIAEGFLFFDWFAIPQITVRKDGVNEESVKSDAALAVQSIPAYVELSNVFIALVPELTHKDSSALVNYASWLSRGWCRAELWCRLLSNKIDTTIIVIHSPTQAEFMFPLDWQHNSIVDGDFTVESDRAIVVQLGETAVESKIQHLQVHGPLRDYRFYGALRPKLLCQDRVDRTLQQFLEDFRFSSLEQAVKDASSMNAVMCAILSGDTGMLALLAESRADMSRPMHGLNDLGFYDTQTLLMAATKSHQDPAVLTTLVELRADPNGRASRTKLSSLYMCRSPGHVRALLEQRAELEHSALHGAASLAGPDTLRELLKRQCDPNHILAGRQERFGPLHAVALFSLSNRHAVEAARLLLEHRADVNARSAPSDEFSWECRKARVRVAVLGFANCNMMTRLRASMSGISPLGYAALVGHGQLTQLFLDHGADPTPNDRGDTPEDLARRNHHYHLIPLLATFAT